MIFNSKIFSILILASVTVGQIEQISQLGRLNIYTQWMTLSGFSSGGSFAQQVQISYSSLFSGIAVFSHTYYRCGPPTGIQEDYDNVCTTLGNRSDPFLYDTNNVLQDIQNYYDQDLIDNPINIRNKRLYVFAGTRNALFTTDMSLRIMQVYEPLIQNTESVKTRVMEAALLLPTVNFGRPCQEDASSNLFLGSCGISGAYEALQFLLGDVVKKPRRNQRIPLQPLQMFDQTEFFYGFNGRHDMDDVGYLYVPSNCNYIKCLFHFYFHGCLTGREFNGTSHIVNSGYLEVAELSNIIMVFPQSHSSPGNEIGCWDTYGFTSIQYATKRGHQVTVIRNILARILGEDDPTVSQYPHQIPSQYLGAQQGIAPSSLNHQTSAVSSQTDLTAFKPSAPILDNQYNFNNLGQTTLQQPVTVTSYFPQNNQINPAYAAYPARQYQISQTRDAGLVSHPFSSTSFQSVIADFGGKK